MALPSMDMKGVTQEEVSKLTKAMKSAEFRDHMDEYCREVSDPGHRKEYRQYLDQLEAKGEVPEGQQLLRCEPGCCVKTWICFKNGQTQKCFINIVHSDRLEDVQMERSDKGDGHQVKLPYSLSPPRPDRDHKDEYCMTCDFAVSSRTYFQAMQYPNYMKMLVDTAADSLSSHHLKGNEEVKKDYKVMQRMACKGGYPMPMSVKAELLRDKGLKPTTPKVKVNTDAVTPSELRQMRKEAKMKCSKQEEQPDIEEPPAQQDRAQAQAAAPAPRIRVPQHKLVHSGTIDLADYMESNQITTAKPSVPKLLKLMVEVPTVKRVGDINLEVTSTNVVVEVPDKYYLDLPLPYEVQEKQGGAKFDKVKQVLTLELPVVPKPQLPNPNFPASQGEAENVPGGGDDDGALSEGHDGSEEDLPALEEEDQPPAAAPASATPSAADAAPGPVVPAAAADRPAGIAAPVRQRLELEQQGSTLLIAQPVPEEGEAQVHEADTEESLQDCPPFVAADFFEGARPGYYFTRGDQGLGYYLDRRQVRPRVPKPPQEVRLPHAAPAPHAGLAAPNEALVSEVEGGGTTAVPSAAKPGSAVAATPVEAEPARRLPAGAQRYVDILAALTVQPLAAAAGAGPASDAGEEPSVEWEQNLQNVMLFIDIPRGQEVAGVHLGLRGQVLTVSFCARAQAADAWRRCVVRRALCGAVDPKQWHVEPPTGPGAPLVVVVRKVDRGRWAEIFDAKAAVAPDPLDFIRDVPASSAAAFGGGFAAGAGAGPCGREPLDVAAAAAAEGGPGPEQAPGLDDSAKLDAAEPETNEASQAGSSAAHVVAEGAARGPATEAMIQSAVVMGQGVLLRNRLMYELL